MPPDPPAMGGTSCTLLPVDHTGTPPFQNPRSATDTFLAGKIIVILTIPFVVYGFLTRLLVCKPQIIAVYTDY